jgi:hypothetical protein
MCRQTSICPPIPAHRAIGHVAREPRCRLRYLWRSNRFPAILAGLATTAHEGTTMNRGDFIDGILVRLKSTGEVMTLGGTEDDWICTAADAGRVVRKHVQPDEVDPVINN